MSEEVSEEIKESDQTQEAESTVIGEEVTVAYENRVEDFITAMEVVDIQNKEGTRKTIHGLALVLVGYWAVQTIMSEPKFLMGWIMLAMAVALGVYIVREPKAGNQKYATKFVERAPSGKVTINEKGLFFEDGTGRDPFLYADGVKAYRYREVIAITGKKRRLAQIPIGQMTERDQGEVMRMLGKGCGVEQVEPQPQKSFFSRK